MLSTTLRLLGHPHWMAEHLQLYGALGRTEAALAWRTLVARALLALVALGCAMVALNLAGLATLLWLAGVIATPTAHAAAWVVAVPALPMAGAAAAWWLARRPIAPWFAHLRAQIDADWKMVQDGHPPAPDDAGAPSTGTAPEAGP